MSRTRRKTDQRAVVLFEELDPGTEDLNKQKLVAGPFSHWEAKKMVNELPDSVYFTVSRKEYENLTAKPARRRRKRRTKAEMAAARSQKAS